MQTQTVKPNKPIKRSKAMNITIVAFSIFLVLYLGISIYFNSHFCFGSKINGINASGKTVEELDKALSSKCKTYTLNLEERNGVKEQIKATDIGLKYNAKDKIQALKDNQNSFTWIFKLFNPKTSELSGIVTYDKKLLKNQFDKLSCFDSKKIIDPKNPSFKYSAKGYTIVKEVIGTKINSKNLYPNVENAILKGEPTINLETTNQYINPKYTSSSKEVKDTKILLDKYVASKITYTFTGGKEVLDGSKIHNWLVVNDNLAISFDKNKIENYVGDIAKNYNTYGNERNFVTSSGSTTKVSGGDYGWLVNRTGEVNDLIVAIKGGQTLTKQPNYTQTALSRDVNDIGNTYVEINIADQHMWFYKHGALVADGAVVTGDVSKNYATPTGVYKLKYKAKNTSLKGPGYNTPVNCFMPFNNGIGIHGAPWKKSFGGNVYLTNGSHGCINATDDLAITIYNNIDANTPVVCY